MGAGVWPRPQSKAAGVRARRRLISPLSPDHTVCATRIQRAVGRRLTDRQRSPSSCAKQIKKELTLHPNENSAVVLTATFGLMCAGSLAVCY